jgi:hypothetical protein
MAFIRKIQTNTVRASGATNSRDFGEWTMPLAWSATISTMISTAAWKRPGTPEVARAARRAMMNTPSRPRPMEKNRVSRWKTDQSTRPTCFLLVRKVRWWTMYSEALGACSVAMFRTFCSKVPIDSL